MFCHTDIMKCGEMLVEVYYAQLFVEWRHFV